MRVLYISTLCSQRLHKDLFVQCPKRTGFAVQKFHKLLSNGLLANGAKIQTLSAIPVTSADFRKKIWRERAEIENGIRFRYIPFVNVSYIRQICLFFYSFYFTLIWGLFKRNEKKVLFDVLNISVCLGALLACKINGVKTIGVMTDMPGLMVGIGSSKRYQNYLYKIASFVNMKYISSFSYYVFLTEAMNDVVNKHHRPYIVMEGLVDPTCASIKNELGSKWSERVVLYAGGLHERYGLGWLVDAFMKLPMDDVRLVIYGGGPYVETLKKKVEQDSRIIYKGLRPNAEVVADEVAAILLVNPRPTTEEFTKYSFPSKNMEYMASGTPLLTTKLPGMPQEYYPYVYTFDDESVEGYFNVLSFVLSKSREELHQKGVDARTFVMNEKNDIQQAAKLMKLVYN